MFMTTSYPSSNSLYVALSLKWWLYHIKNFDIYEESYFCNKILLPPYSKKFKQESNG